MAIAPFLAMTLGEISSCAALPEKIAWMACHFSPYGLGLSNLPRSLPPNSLLILDDITPIRGHDPHIILQQLTQYLHTCPCEGVLLDFQRADAEETENLVQVLTEGLPCPVGVSHYYAKGGSFPIFLPPIPLSTEPQSHFAPWKDREIWLEVAMDALEITVTEQGASFVPVISPPPTASGFADERLCCHYKTEILGDNVKFLLWRTEEDLENLMEFGKSLGVTHFVGLYQELRKRKE